MSDKELKDYTISELRDHLEHRAIEDKPKIFSEPVLEELEELVQEYVDFAWSEEFHREHDYETDIFERALCAYFGHDFWRKHMENTGYGANQR